MVILLPSESWVSGVNRGLWRPRTVGTKTELSYWRWVTGAGKLFLLGLHVPSVNSELTLSKIFIHCLNNSMSAHSQGSRGTMSLNCNFLISA